MEEGWDKLSREEKRERRLKNYLNPPPGTQFVDTRAEKRYKARAARILAANKCEKPDRVPVSLPVGHYAAYYSGYNLKKVMYDYKANRESLIKFVQDFNDHMDSVSGGGAIAGRALDLMDNINYAWPGHGLSDEATTHEYKEAKYIDSTEYNDYIRDPSDFAFRVLTPRTAKGLERLKNFICLNGIMTKPLEIAASFTRPEVREAFRKLIAAGEELEQQQKENQIYHKYCISMGLPMPRGGAATAPYDLIADVLRGTQGVAFDIYRMPEKVLETIEVITKLEIDRLIKSANETGFTSVMFPLHKGDDKFMSVKQFEKFYWPSLKRVVDALIAEGIMVHLFAEGSYNQRLSFLGDFPKGWVTYLFDQTNMEAAKKACGKTCCISGNVPASLMVTATPQQVKDYCRDLIEKCAPGGGFILAGGCQATETKNPANFWAFMEMAEKYGKY
jgi:uroporphyrinogen-III decarboxylase